jgi:hypothetical protein
MLPLSESPTYRLGYLKVNYEVQSTKGSNRVII